MLTSEPVKTEKSEIEFPPEVELILCCARTTLATSKIERIKTLIQQDINWDYIIQKSISNQVTALLYYHLNTHFSQLVPELVLDELMRYFQGNARRNLFLTNELLKILSLFESQGIYAIPIKGVNLAISAYKNLALRQFSDIDILVRKKDAMKARDLLVSLGYESTYNFTREQEVARLTSPYCKDNNYQHKLKGVTVDFHWQLLQKYLNFPLDHELLWQRNGVISLAGKTILNLSPEDNLLFLCVHGSRDRWNKLKLISDIAELIQVSPNIDWESIIKRAKKLGCWRRFLLGILLAKNLLEAELPKEIWQNVQAEDAIKPLATEVIERLFLKTYERPKIFEQFVFDLKIRERPQDKFQYSIYQTILVGARSNGILPTWI